MTKEEQERLNEILNATKLDTFNAWHWLRHLLDGNTLDENRIEYLRVFLANIVDILSDHEIYTTKDLKDAMNELCNLQALSTITEKLNYLEEQTLSAIIEKLNYLDKKICDIIQSIEKR